VQQSNRATRIAILGTGGTIAGRAATTSDHVGYVAGQVSVQDLVAAVPALAEWPLEAEQVAQIDSKDMGLAIWQRLVLRVQAQLAREDIQGLVITHGTDTIEETAFLLHTLLRPAKPVVLTCAMRPASALVPDGPQNLLDAVAVAAAPGLAGVVVVCAGQIHAALHVTKVHTYRTDAFDSGDAGPLGCVEAGVVRGFQPWAVFADAGQRADRLAAFLRAQALPRVAWITSHADADGDVVRGLLALGQQDPQRMPQGLLVAGTGNGTLHAGLLAALQEAQAQGVRVLRSTRCARGRVIADASQTWPQAATLTAAKARLALALDLLPAG
jgi:L-asparaginase